MVNSAKCCEEAKQIRHLDFAMDMMDPGEGSSGAEGEGRKLGLMS